MYILLYVPYIESLSSEVPLLVNPRLIVLHVWCFGITPTT